MPGRTGKKHNPKRPCGRCGEKIEGDFYRTKKADYCRTCYEEHVNKKS